MGKATGRGRPGGGSKKSKPSFKKGKKSFKSGPKPRPQSESEGSDSDAEQGGIEAMLSRIKGLRSDESEAGEDFEDEELDSDMADTDGEDGPAPTEKKPKAAKQRRTEIDLNEDSEPEVEPEEDGMVDLSTMLDLRLPSDEQEDSEYEAAADAPDFSEDEAEQSADEQALDKLNAFIQGLPGQEAQETDQGPLKKRKLAERTETQPESEFAPVNKNKKLRLEDMLATLPASQAKEVKKSIKPMLKSQDASKEQEPGTSTLRRNGALPAPLDSRSQAKLDRQAARDKLGGEVDKWNSTVAQMKGIGNKDSEYGAHRLVLPLNAPDLKSRPSAAELSSKFTASNDLEKAISGLLESSAVANPAQQAQSEQEKMAKMRLSAEEQVARQAAVRRQRELMFRAERKSKRLNKIKSKTYRRLARKEAKNDGLSMEELEQLDDLDEGTRAAEAREKMEAQRAKERATLRHSSKSTKFSRDVNGMYGLEVNDELRQAEVERVQREAALRKKIMGQQSGSESDEDDDESLDEGNEDAIKAAALRSMDKAAAKAQAEDAEAEKPKGVMGMKFMQAARARKEAEQKQLEDAFRRELEGEEVEDGSKDHASVQGNAGRRVFVPSKAAQTVPAQDDEEAQPAPSKPRKNKTQSQTITIDAPPQASTSTAESAPPVNPWLAAAGVASTSKASTKQPTSITAADKASLKAKKQKSKNTDDRAKQQQENQVELDPSQLLVKEKKSKKPRQRKSKAEKKAAAGSGEQEQGQMAPVAAQSDRTMVPALDADEGSSSQDEDYDEPDDDEMFFRQRDLVARAFAGDDVVADFEAEKAREVEGDAPQDLDVTIPGWGSWGGKGVRRKNKPAKKFTKHVAGVDTASRKDAGLNHVILSEKREKHAAKYLVKDLPFPYTSAAQHEQALRMPTGPEWQTNSTHRSFTRPDVLTRMGQIIDPVSRQS